MIRIFLDLKDVMESNISKIYPRTCRDKLQIFKHSIAKNWDNCQSVQDLKMPLGEFFKDDMWNLHAKFHKFSRQRNGNINLSLFSFSEICTMG
jgi:hypothetical protein